MNLWRLENMRDAAGITLPDHMDKSSPFPGWLYGAARR
jgi:hypothetical protein